MAESNGSRIKKTMSTFDIILFNGGIKGEAIIWIAKKKEYRMKDESAPGKEAFSACLDVLKAAKKRGLKFKKIISNSDLPIGMVERVNDVLLKWSCPEFAVLKGGHVRNYY